MQTLPPQDDLIRQRLERLLQQQQSGSQFDSPKIESAIPSNALRDQETPTKHGSRLVGEHQGTTASSKATLAVLMFLASFAGTQSVMDELERQGGAQPVLALSDSLKIAPSDSQVKPLAASPITTPGLSSKHSTLTGILDPASLTASYYWTIELTNTSGQSKEARLAMKLPEGATVSRGTLWVNGVPQEAAFDARDVVANAYADVAYSPKQRDPLLIEKVGANIVSIKASPVPRDGSPMLIRIGIVAPLTQLENGTCKVELPTIAESNASLQGITDFHIESAQPLTANDVNFKTSSAGSTFISKANTKQSLNESTFLFAGRDASMRQFATRATHSTDGFIVANLAFDPLLKENRLYLNMASSRPGVPIITDEDAAHRLSTLWAYNESEKLNKRGERMKAVELGHVYRFVSWTTAATVLERESDYSSHGLNRDQYKTLSFTPSESGHSSNVAPTLQGATSSIIIPNFNESENLAPHLSGATNGTIGPQGIEATVIQQLNGLNEYHGPTVISGVNTPGTVRLDNQDQLMQWFTVFLGVCGVIFGALLWLRALAERARRRVAAP